MKRPYILQILFVLLIIKGCATQQLTNQGQSAYQKGNYESALESFEQVIEKGESSNGADAEVYFKAGMAAWELGQAKKAIRYLERAEYLEYPSPTLYITLARAAQSIDNLSKELDALENYREKFPQGRLIDSMSLRLFETYVESENWKKATDLWPGIKQQARSEVDLLAGYLKANNKLENDKAADSTAQKILDQDPDNIAALEWMGKKYFWKAEDIYVKEMTDYKNNRTTSQYKRLLNKLDEVYPTFEKARDYFLQLYKLKPSPEYAEFLGNIYKRLQKEQKAEYYYNKAKQR